MTTRPSGYALDASLVIAYLNAAEPHHDQAAGFLHDHAEGDFWMSSITMAEVLVAYARAGRLGEGATVLAELGIEEQSLPDDAAARLASLRADTGLRMPDCCVVMAAEQTGSAVASFDSRLREAAARRGLTVLP